MAMESYIPFASYPVPFIFYHHGPDFVHTYDSGTFSVPLEGPQAGVKISGKNLTIDDYGDDFPYSPGASPGIGWPISEKSSNIGAIVGGIIAVVIVVAAILGFIFYRRKQQLAKSGYGTGFERALPQPPHQQQGQKQEMNPEELVVHHGPNQSPLQQEHDSDLQSSTLSTGAINTLSTPGSPLPLYSNAPPMAGPYAISSYTRPITPQHGFP